MIEDERTGAPDEQPDEAEAPGGVEGDAPEPTASADPGASPADDAPAPDEPEAEEPQPEADEPAAASAPAEEPEPAAEAPAEPAAADAEQPEPAAEAPAEPAAAEADEPEAPPEPAAADEPEAPAEPAADADEPQAPAEAAQPEAAQPEAAAEPPEAADEPAAAADDAAEPAAQPETDAEPPAADAEAPAAPPAADAEPDRPRRERPRRDKDEKKEEEVVPGAHLEPDLVLESERPTGGDDLEDQIARYAAPEEGEAEEAQPDAAAEAPTDAPSPRSALDLAADARYRATGKRKTAVARVILRPGEGAYSVNGRSLEDFFPRAALQKAARQPLEVAGFERRMDVVARIHGGGVASQAGALRHGVARALVEADPNLRPELKRRGLLTRDARAKERKKAGLKKARKRPQFSKR